MNRLQKELCGTFAALVVTLVALSAVVPVAAQDGPPPPGQGGFGGGGGRGGQGGGRMNRTPPPVSAATVPVEVMTAYLKLTDTQVTQIKTISDALRETMRPPRPQDDGSGTPPTPPTQEQRDADRKTRDAAVKKADADVTTVLDDTQKSRLATLLKGFEALRVARVQPPTVTALKLTDEEWTALAALGTKATRDSVSALLTDAQKTTLAAARPPRSGRGGGQGGGGDFPPPPPGEGGPPPPPGEGAPPPPPGE